MITFEHGPCYYEGRDPPSIVHDQNNLLLHESVDSGILIFEKDPSSFGLGVFLWRRVYSLGTHSLFLGLNYPMNVEIHDGQPPDGTLKPFLRKNCVYGSYYGFSATKYPFISRWNLQPGKEERMGVISLPRDGWGRPRQTAMWFKPSLCNIRSS